MSADMSADKNDDDARETQIISIRVINCGGTVPAVNAAAVGTLVRLTTIGEVEKQKQRTLLNLIDRTPTTHESHS